MIKQQAVWYVQCILFWSFYIRKNKVYRVVIFDSAYKVCLHRTCGWLLGLRMGYSFKLRRLGPIEKMLRQKIFTKWLLNLLAFEIATLNSINSCCLINVFLIGLESVRKSQANLKISIKVIQDIQKKFSKRFSNKVQDFEPWSIF